MCKARLVVKSYNQELGRDYTETFSPVIKVTTLQTILDIDVSRSLPLQQLDVNNAFLQGILIEEFYMEQTHNLCTNPQLIIFNLPNGFSVTWSGLLLMVSSLQQRMS